MEFESFVSNMMKMNLFGRLWHWATDSAQHHVTFEKFLTSNELFTDSLVESMLGNDIPLAVEKISTSATLGDGYRLEQATSELVRYRNAVRKMQDTLSKSDAQYQAELTAILDDVNELCSKTLYLLKLS